MSAKEFKKLDSSMLRQLSNKELIEYYKGWKEYCLKLPYDARLIKKQETRQQLACVIGIPLVRLFLNPRFINRELIPEKKGVIFTSNHLTYWDQLPIISAIGFNPTHFMIASTLFETPLLFGKPLGPFYEATGAIPVNRDDEESKSTSLDTAMQILLHGGNVVMFPEGTRKPTGEILKKFKLGAVIAAKVTGAPIVPLAINKDYKRGNLIVRFGNSIEVSHDEDLLDANQRLYDTILSLVHENNALEEERKKVKYIQKNK